MLINADKQTLVDLVVGSIMIAPTSITASLVSFGYIDDKGLPNLCNINGLNEEQLFQLYENIKNGSVR